MEKQAHVSINTTTEVLLRRALRRTVYRAEENTAHLFVSQRTGKSVPALQGNWGYASCMLCTAKLQPGTAASRGCPSLPCPTATSSFREPGFAAIPPQAGQALFSVSTINRNTEIRNTTENT